MLAKTRGLGGAKMAKSAREDKQPAGAPTTNGKLAQTPGNHPCPAPPSHPTSLPTASSPSNPPFLVADHVTHTGAHSTLLLSHGCDGGPRQS